MSLFLDLLSRQVQEDRNDLERFLTAPRDFSIPNEQAMLKTKISSLQRSIENLKDGNYRLFNDNYKLQRANGKLQNEIDDLNQAVRHLLLSRFHQPLHHQHLTSIFRCRPR